jgi:hypothetical protein
VKKVGHLSLEVPGAALTWLGKSMLALVVTLTLTLGACTSLPSEPGEPQEESQDGGPPVAVLIARNPWSDISGAIVTSPDAVMDPILNWSHFPFPGKSATKYQYAFDEGRKAMLAKSINSSSMLRREVRLEPKDLDLIQFSWKVPEHINYCGQTVDENDDSPVRIFLTFEGDRSKFSTKNALLAELAHLLLGEPLPYATLVYVWSHHKPLESIIHSARTDRVRSIVVESGTQQLGQWKDYQRHIRADFEKAYGEPPGALLRVAIMTDNDSTCAPISAWYGSLSLKSNALQK